MKPRDWFGLGVRFTGLWCLMQSVGYLLFFLDVRLGFSAIRDVTQAVYGKDSPQGYLLYAAVYAALAYYFLLCTEHLTRWTFHETALPSQPEIEADIPQGTDSKSDSE